MKESSESLAMALARFAPSDRQYLTATFGDANGRDAAVEAVTLYVSRWEEGDWLDEYAIERIGRWLGRTAPDVLVQRLLEWAKSPDSAARAALIRGLATSALFASG